MGVELSGGWKAGKYLIFFFNLIFWIFGLALIVVGAIAMDKYGDIFNLAGHGKWTSGPALVIAVGVIIFLVAFFGCIGAIAQNRPFLYIFAILMSVMFIVTITGVILVAVYKKQITSHLEKAMNDTMKEYDHDLGVTDTWDGMQSKFPKCCGTVNFTDWFGVYAADTVPDSCCKKTGCKPPYDYSTIHIDGCYNATIGSVEEHWPAAAGISAAVAVIELIAVILGCGLARAISSSKYEVV